MKYVKTFENFNHKTTNEGLLWGEGSVWSKIGNWYSGWKNKKMAEGAAKAKEALEKNPEKLKEAQAKVSPELGKLSEEDKKELVSKLENFKGQEPPADVLSAAEEVSKVEEKLKNLKYGSKIYESTSLILEEAENNLSKKILSWLGLGLKFVGIISIAISVLLYIYGVITAVVFAGPFILLGAIVGGMALIIAGGVVDYKVNGDSK